MKKANELLEISNEINQKTEAHLLGILSILEEKARLGDTESDVFIQDISDEDYHIVIHRLKKLNYKVSMMCKNPGSGEVKGLFISWE